MTEYTGWKCKNCGNFNVRTETCLKCGKVKGFTLNQSQTIDTVALPQSNVDEYLKKEGIKMAKKDNPTVKDLDENTLVEVLQERQKKLLALMPRYARRIFNWAIFFFLINSVFQFIIGVIAIFTSTDTSQEWLPNVIALVIETIQTMFAAHTFSLGSVISALLTLFSNILMWAFMLWSITFVPFLAINSYKFSQESTTKLATRPLKWVQLFAATFLPMAAFAIAWNSTATRTTNIVVEVKSSEEAVLLVVGTIVVAGILFVINKVISSDAIAIRLSILSAIIYTSLYLAYGQGYSVASLAMLFGILSYLMFGSGQIEEVGRRIVVFDLAPDISKKVDVINSRFQSLQVTHDEIALSERENRMLSEQSKAKSRLAESQMEQKLGDQLSEIQSRKIELVHRMNRTQIEILEKKIDMLDQAFEIVSKEYTSKLAQDFPKQLDELKEAARTLPANELSAKMNDFMGGMNLLLEGLPETLGELKTQVLKAANDLESQTRLLLPVTDKTADEEK